MKLDLSKLSEAVNHVAGLASSHASVVAQHADLTSQVAALLADAQASQEAVDTLTASLLAATTSPAEAVGIAAVAAALDPNKTVTVPPPAGPAVTSGPVGAIPSGHPWLHKRPAPAPVAVQTPTAAPETPVVSPAPVPPAAPQAAPATPVSPVAPVAASVVPAASGTPISPAILAATAPAKAGTAHGPVTGVVPSFLQRIVDDMKGNKPT